MKRVTKENSAPAGPGRHTWLAGLFLLLCIHTLHPAATHAAGTTVEFNHFSTGFPLEGAHRNAGCSSCHLHGIFAGTPVTCAACHDQGTLIPADKKPSNHIQTVSLCEECHTDRFWKPLAHMDHNAVIGACFSCHNGSTATGKAPNHIASDNTCDDCHTTNAWTPAVFDHAGVGPGTCTTCHNGSTATGKSSSHLVTAAPCDDCHSTIAWVPASFDHALVSGACFSCHNGSTATGKTPNHIASDNTCDDCHTTNAWTPAVFDHAGVSPGTCTTCHNGSTATGKSSSHLVTAASCDDCHSTIAWVPASFDHALVSGACSSCHNGSQATGKSNSHFVTSLQCDTCHTTAGWIPLDFRHSSPAYPGDHRTNLLCSDCHRGNSESVAWAAPAYVPDCAACHVNDFKSSAHKKYENPDAFYSASELRDCSGSCHLYTDSSMTTIKDRRSGPEHRITDGNFD